MTQRTRIHVLDLVLHVGNFDLSRLNLFLELLDLVVQHELELFQLLILLLELKDTLLLVADCLVALFDLQFTRG